MPTARPATCEVPPLDPAVLARVAALVDEVVRLVDGGEVQATAPERAYLAGVSASLGLVAGAGSRSAATR